MYSIARSENDILSMIVNIIHNSRHRLLRNENRATADRAVAYERRNGRPVMADDPIVDGHEGEEVEVGAQPRNAWVNIYNDVVSRLKPGEVVHANGEPMAVKYEGEDGLLYIQRDGRIHNITTHKKWVYPALVEVIPSVLMDGTLSTNIAVCRKQVAKKLVYQRDNKFIEKFDQDILSSSNFHVVNYNNRASYVDAASNNFFAEVDNLIENGNDIVVNNDEYIGARTNLLYKLKNSKHSYLVSAIKRNSVKNGKISCSIVYSLVSLQEAKKLVHWHKNSKNSSKPFSFGNFTYKTSHDALHDGNDTYRRTGRFPHTADFPRPNNFPTVERVEEDVEVEAPIADRRIAPSEQDIEEVAQATEGDTAPTGFREDRNEIYHGTFSPRTTSPAVERSSHRAPLWANGLNTLARDNERTQAQMRRPIRDIVGEDGPQRIGRDRDHPLNRGRHARQYVYEGLVREHITTGAEVERAEEHNDDS